MAFFANTIRLRRTKYAGTKAGGLARPKQHEAENSQMQRWIPGGIVGTYNGALASAIEAGPVPWTLSGWRRRVHPWPENTPRPTRWISGRRS